MTNSLPEQGPHVKWPEVVALVPAYYILFRACVDSHVAYCSFCTVSIVRLGSTEQPAEWCQWHVEHRQLITALLHTVPLWDIAKKLTFRCKTYIANAHPLGFSFIFYKLYPGLSNYCNLVSGSRKKGRERLGARIPSSGCIRDGSGCIRNVSAAEMLTGSALQGLFPSSSPRWSPKQPVCSRGWQQWAVSSHCGESQWYPMPYTSIVFVCLL